MKTLSLNLCALVCCFFVTNLHAEPCWQNQTTESVMPQKICFDEIRLEKKQNIFKNIYLLNSDIDESLPLNSITKLADGNFEVSLKSDYLNYSENCGLNLFSKIDFVGVFSAEGKYVEHQKSKMTLRYTYTANNCRTPAKPGSETYLPIKK